MRNWIAIAQAHGLPLAGSVSCDGLFLLAKFDSYLLTRRGRSPDRHRPVALQHHVVAKHVGDSNIPAGMLGSQTGGGKQNEGSD